MARKKRTPSPTGLYHWIVRGIHKKHIFHRSEDFQVFKDLLLRHKIKFGISIHHYCLMNNHVHLLLQAKEDIAPLAGFSAHVLRRYAYYYCAKYKWTGSVFMRGYQSIPVLKDDYLLECGRYIERNPLQAHLSASPEEYPHSSFRHYKTGGDDELVTDSPAYTNLDPVDDIRRKLYAAYVETNRMKEEELLKAL